jgi:hypothetical protein
MFPNSFPYSDFKLFNVETAEEREQANQEPGAGVKGE